jgi:hypothetical protein
MKVHPRTIERRIAAGKIDNRRNDDGQVQVLVAVPDPVETVSTASPGVSVGAFETVRELADRQVDIAAGSASALVRVAQDQTIRAENELTLARQTAGRYRRELKLALGMLAIAFLLMIAAVGWCTRAVTLAHAEAAAREADARLASVNADNARLIAIRATDDARQAQALVQIERNRSQSADIARAKAEGELAAYKAELSDIDVLSVRRPATTRPTNFVERMTQAFMGRD